MKPFNSSQSGMSLLSVVVAMGLASMLAALMATQIGHAIQVQKIIKEKNDRESIRMMVMTQISCKTTMAGKCKPNQPTKLKRANNMPFGTIVGWELRGLCTQNGKAIVIQARKLTKQFKSLNPVGVSICAAK